MLRIIKRFKELYDAPSSQETGKFLRWKSDGTLENASAETPKARVLWVSSSGGDYTSVAGAYNYAAGVATRTNPYVVKVGPGSYTESPFTLSRWVSLQGSGVFATTISTNNNNAHFLTSSAEVGLCEISDVSIQGPTGTGFAAIYYDAPYNVLDPNELSTNQRHHPFFIYNVLVRSGYYGLLVNSGNVHCFGLGGYSSHAKTNMKAFIRVQNYGFVTAMNSSYSCWFEKNATEVGFEVSGPNARITLDGCTFTSPTYASDDPLYDYSGTPSMWSSESVVSLNTILEKTFSYRGSSTTFFFVCTTAGTTGVTEPIWGEPSTNGDLGATITDGGVVWTNWGVKPLNWVDKTIALSVDDGAYARVNNCTFSAARTLIQVGSTGSDTRVVCTGTTLKDWDFATDTTFKHIDILSNSAHVEFFGNASKERISKASGALFIGQYSDATPGEEGVVINGEAWLGTAESSIPLRDYGLKTYSTGLYDGGGIVTAGTGLHVNVSAGEGYINNFSTVKRIAWTTTNDIDVVANAENYIYVDIDGHIHASTIKPSLLLNIVIGACWTDDTSVVSVADYNAEIEQIIPTLHEYFSAAIGPISISGGLATIHSAPSTEIDVSGGSYYRAYELTTSTEAIPATFTYWYKKSGGGWNTVTSSANIDNLNYDDGSGTLAVMTDNNYKKDVLFIVVNGGDTEFHVVYGQEQFASQGGAEAGAIPSCPEYLLEHGLRSSGIVIKKSNNISSIVDIRPRLGQSAPAVATITNHNDLSGIQGGQAGQYYHLNSSQYNDLANKLNLAASNTTFGSGTVQLIGSNAISVLTASTNGNQVIIDGPSQSVQTQNLVSINGSTGAINLSNSGSGNIAFGGSGSTITASFNQSNQTGNIINAAVIAGNTSGATASVSSGTMVFAGGNNITLSQNANSVTISGLTTGSMLYSNANNVTFGVSSDNTNSTITASASFNQSVQTQNIVSALNSSQGSVVIAAGTNISISNSASTINIALSAVPNINDLVISSGVSNYGSQKDVIDAKKEPMGFPNTTDSTLSFVYGTGIFTVAPASGSFKFYNKGLLYTKNSSETTTLALTDGLHYIYYNGSTLTNSTNVFDLSTHTPVAIIYINSNMGDYILYDERHGIGMDWETHLALHVNVGAYKLGSGFDLSGWTPQTDTLAGVSFAISSGVIADEDIYHALATLSDNQGIGDQYPIFYRVGTGSRWDWILRNIPYHYSAGNNLYYNQNNNGTWQLTEVTNNDRYVNYYLCAQAAIGVSAPLRYLFIAGQSVYTSLANAQGESISSLDLTGLPAPEIVPLYRITLRYRTTYSTTTAQTRIEAITSIVGVRVSVASGSTGALPAHNSLPSRDVYPAHPYQAIDFANTNASDGMALLYNTNTTNSAEFAYIPRAVVINGNTSGATASVSSGTLNLFGGNNVTLSQNGNSVTVSAVNTIAQSVQTQGIQSLIASNATFTSGGPVLVGSNALTVKTGAGSIIFDTPTQTQFLFSNSNSFTFGTGTGANTSVVTASFSQSTHSHSTSPAALAVLGNTSGTMSTITSGTVYLSGGSNVTLSQDGNSIAISAHGPIYLSAGTTSASNGTIAFSSSNNVNFGMSGSTITASATFPAQTQFVLSNANGLGWGTNGSTVTGSYTQSTHSHSEYSFINSNNVTFGTTNGSQVTATATFAGGAGVAIAAGGNTAGAMATVTNGSAVFMGGPNITISQNSNSISISANNPGAAAENNYHEIGGNTAGANSTLSGSTIGIYGGNNITVSQNGSTITISAPNMIKALSGSNATIDGGTVTFGNLNGISFYVTNGSMVGSYVSANTATYLSMYPPLPLPFVQYSSNSVAAYSGSAGTGANTSLTTCSVAVFPLAIAANLSYEGVRLPVLSSLTTTVSSVNFSNSWGYSFGLYTHNDTVMNSLSQWTAEYRYSYASATNSTNASASWQCSYGRVGGNSSSTSVSTNNAAATAFYSYFTGSKWIRFAGSELGGQTLGASQYYGVLNHSVSTAGSSLHVNSLCAISQFNSTWGQDAGHNIAGGLRNLFPGQGVASFVLSSNSKVLPNIATSNITQTAATNAASLINKFPYIMINNRL